MCIMRNVHTSRGTKNCETTYALYMHIHTNACTGVQFWSQLAYVLCSWSCVNAILEWCSRSREYRWYWDSASRMMSFFQCEVYANSQEILNDCVGHSFELNTQNAPKATFSSVSTCFCCLKQWIRPKTQDVCQCTKRLLIHVLLYYNHFNGQHILTHTLAHIFIHSKYSDWKNSHCPL